MKEFKSYFRYISNNQLKTYGSFGRFGKGQKRTKADKLIDGIMLGKYTNDTDAANDLYGVKPDDKSYLMLKSRVKEQILNYVFQVDMKKLFANRDYGFHIPIAHKLLAAGQIMINFGLSIEGEAVLKECLGIAIPRKFTSIIINASRLLRSRMSFKGTMKEYQYYNKLIIDNIEKQKAEIEADDIRDALNLAYRNTFSPQDKRMLTKYWRRINVLNEKFDSYFIKANRFRIGARYYETIGDFQSIIMICNEWEEFMRANTVFYDVARHREFLNSKLEACILLKNYNVGMETAEKCLKLHNNYSSNSLSVYEYYILLSLHTKNYHKAWELFLRAVGNALFTQYPDERREKWRLYEAYLTFVAPDPQRKFKLFKFLNDMPVFSKDKRGINIAIIIAQIILLLDEGKFDTLMDKADAFKIYFKRYVVKEINYRTFYFVKMLELLFKYSFDYKLVKKHAIPLYERLGDKKGHYHGDIEALEIIPYEELWRQILIRIKSE